MAINDIAAGDLVTFIKWNDTNRDQTCNISHSELLKYVLFVKFANLQWMCLNWILLRKCQSLICFTWTSLQVYNKHKTQETVICSVKFHAWVWKKIWNGSPHVFKKFLLEQVPVFIIIFLDSEEEY